MPQDHNIFVGPSSRHMPSTPEALLQHMYGYVQVWVLHNHQLLERRQPANVSWEAAQPVARHIEHLQGSVESQYIMLLLATCTATPLLWSHQCDGAARGCSFLHCRQAERMQPAQLYRWTRPLVSTTNRCMTHPGC
jgi:hypothetical protein